MVDLDHLWRHMMKLGSHCNTLDGEYLDLSLDGVWLGRVLEEVLLGRVWDWVWVPTFCFRVIIREGIFDFANSLPPPLFVLGLLRQMMSHAVWNSSSPSKKNPSSSLSSHRCQRRWLLRQLRLHRYCLHKNSDHNEPYFYAYNAFPLH